MRIHAAKYAASLASRNPASSASPEARIAALLEDAAAGSSTAVRHAPNTHVYDAKLDIVLRLLLQHASYGSSHSYVRDVGTAFARLAAGAAVREGA